MEALKEQDGLLRFPQDIDLEDNTSCKRLPNRLRQRLSRSGFFRSKYIFLLLMSLILLKWHLKHLFPSFQYSLTLNYPNELFKSSEYRSLVAHRLSGAVQIPTITYDDMGALGQDERWDVFYDMGAYLEATFPRL